MMLRKSLMKFVWKKMIEKNDKKIDKKIDKKLILVNKGKSKKTFESDFD